VAVQITELLIDDLTGGDAAETVKFAYEGVEYTIDLNERNAAKLRKSLRPFVDAGVRVPRQRTKAVPIEETTAGRAMIRTWAWGTGRFKDLGDRGRIPRSVVDAYYAAN
jgi:hypothetical protein